MSDTNFETQLSETGNATVAAATVMQIVDASSYEYAAGFLQEIKRRAKQVAEYWKPAKEKAQAAHKDIVAREKSMLEPLDKAEIIIKRSMGAYQTSIEQERRKQEAEARRKQQEERDRLLAEAVAASEAQDHVGAETNMAMAAMIEDMPVAPVIQSAPAAAGISTRKAWKARIVDASAVPIYVNGTEVRKIDESALNAIAKLTKGTAQVPGVEFYEESIITART